MLTSCVYVNKQKQAEAAVAQDDTPWGFTDLVEKLTSWLPKLTWMKQLFITIIMVIVLSMVLCVVN